jgi:putative endopeptidase
MLRSKIGPLLFIGVLVFPPFSFPQEPAQAGHQSVLDVSSMDTSIDPCVDFYTYSCGEWMKKNPVPPDQSSWSIYGKLQDENRVQLRGILESAAAASGHRTAYTQKIGDYYASCMDERAIERAGITPLQRQLDVIEKLDSKSGLAEVVGSMASARALFEFRSDQDYRDSTQVIAEADQGGLGMPDRDYYLKDDAKSEELRKGYGAHVQRMFELLGDKPETAAAEARTVMRIETELARSSMSRVERRDPKRLYHKMTVAELQKLSRMFRWKVYLAKVESPGLTSLNVETPKFFQTMNQQIEKEDLTAWKAYLRWRLVDANARYLSSGFVNEDFSFNGKILLGSEQLEPRWKRCVEAVDNNLGEALGQAYVEKYFSADAKQQALEMVKEIEAAMQQDIETLPWMSADTKRAALGCQQGGVPRPVARLQQAGDRTRG